jgi:hypothetical protein
MSISAPPIRQAPLGPQTQPAMDRHDIVCVHTMVGYLVSTDGYFRISNGAGYDGTESHYGVGGKWGPDLGGGWDGAIWQWQTLARTADANYQGNGRVISIETADNSPARPEDIAEWTPAQVAGLINLIAWLCTPAAHAGCPAGWACRQEGIPAVLIPDTQSHRRGLAYHAQGAAERTVGEWWSTSASKGCPTRRRIDQFRNDVIPGVQRKLAGQPQEVLMALTDAQQTELLATVKRMGGQVDQLQRILADNDVVGKLNRLGAAVGLLGDDEAKAAAALAAAKTEIVNLVRAQQSGDLPAEDLADKVIDALGQRITTSPAA